MEAGGRGDCPLLLHLSQALGTQSSHCQSWPREAPRRPRPGGRAKPTPTPSSVSTVQLLLQPCPPCVTSGTVASGRVQPASACHPASQGRVLPASVPPSTREVGTSLSGPLGGSWRQLWVRLWPPAVELVVCVTAAAQDLGGLSQPLSSARPQGCWTRGAVPRPHSTLGTQGSSSWAEEPRLKVGRGGRLSAAPRLLDLRPRS